MKLIAVDANNVNQFSLNRFHVSVKMSEILTSFIFVTNNNNYNPKTLHFRVVVNCLLISIVRNVS